MIELIKGDITKIKVDAIVNAANTSLLGGGGVDGAIHRAGGKDLLEECFKVRNRQGGCKVGQAVITKAGNLPSNYVIHTVGPKWNSGKNDEENQLTNSYINTLKIALKNNIKSLAFPNISTGIYGYPKEKAANIAINSILSFQKENDQIEKIIFVCFDEDNYKYYKNILLKKGYNL